MNDLDSLKSINYQFLFYAHKPDDAIMLFYLKQDTGDYAYVAALESGDIFKLGYTYEEALDSLIFLYRDLDWFDRK